MAVDFTRDLFFDESNDPFAVGPLYEPEDALKEIAMGRRPFSQGDAVNAIAPPTAPPGLGMAMPPGSASPTIPGGTPPFNPNAPAPGMPGMPQGGGLNAAMNSPGAAMASQAMNNMFQMRRGRAPSTTPVAAYQEAVNRQAILKQRDKAQELQRTQDARAAEKHEADMNPMYEFEQFIEKQGLQGAPYADQLSAFQAFQRSTLKGATDTSEIKNLAARKRIVDSIAAGDGKYTEEDLTRFDEDVSKTQWQDVGAYKYDPVSDTYIPKGLNPNEELSYIRAKTLEQATAKTDTDFAGLIDSGHIDSLEQQLANTQALRAKIEAGDIDGTGPLEGQWNLFFGDPETAVLQMQSTMQALQNLQITNLAPVTENEIKMIQDLYANIGRDPEQNIALLKQAEKMLQDKMDLINKKGQYWADNDGTLKGYNTNTRWKKTERVTGPNRPGT